MRIIATLLVLEAVLQSCALSVDFDIGTSDHPEFSLESHQECTLTHRTYRPVKDDLAVTVSHNERRLWNTREGERCVNVKVSSRGQSPLFLHVVYTRENVEEHYYWVFRREWIMCMKSEYDEALENERLQTINIDSPSAFLGDLQKNGNLAKEETFVANEKCKIIKVEDGGRTVWEAGKNDKLLSYMLLSDKNKVDLLHLVMTNGEEFYELSNDGYKRITKKEFKERDDKMSTYKLAIDINDVKSDKYDMSEYKCAGFPATSFTPKRHLSFVTDDGTFICSFASGVKIKKVTVYKGSTKKFMDVEYYRGKRNAHAYFIKGQDSWEKVSMEDYYAALRRQPEFDTSSPTSLNIRSPDEKMCRIEDTGSPVYERVIIPKNEFRVTKVYDSDKLIREKDVSKHILKATVYFDNGKPALLTLKYADVEKHFERLNDGSWSKVRFNLSFNNKVKKLKSKILELKINETNTVDISVRDKNICGFSEYEHCGIPTVSFMPRGKILIVKDDDLIVHAFPKETEVPGIRLYTTNDFTILNLSYRQSRFGRSFNINLYFEKVNGKWKESNEERFKKLVNPPEWEKPKSPTTKQNVTLDVADVDGAYFTKEKSEDFSTIIPRQEYKLTEIKDGGKEVWKHNEVNRCTTVWIDYKNDKPSLIHALMDNTNLMNQYFEKKEDGKWQSITEAAYNKARGE